MSKYITTEKLCHKLWIGLVTTMTKHYQDNGDILIRNSDIKECKLVESGIYLNKSFSNQHEGRKLQEDDVVTVHTGDVGTSAKISGKFISSHGFATINSRLNTELIDPDYYCRYLNSIFFKQQIYQVITGDGRDNLNLNDFAKLKVRVPELPTQKRIAKILSTVDGQIEKTEAVIAKYQYIKQGMLHDLFTRGIDLSTGKLRQPTGQSTELYKTNNSSRTLMLNKYITTEKLCHKLWIGLVTTMTKHYQDNGDILIRNSDIKECKLVESGIYLNKSFSNQHESRKLQENDVVTVHTGEVGTSAKISGKFIGSHGFATINSRLNTELIDPDYYCRYLNSIFFKQQIYQVITGDGRDNLNLNDFAKLKVLVPDSPTQKRVNKLLSNLDELILTETQKFEKLQKLKQGLMSKLLNGDV